MSHLDALIYKSIPALACARGGNFILNIIFIIKITLGSSLYITAATTSSKLDLHATAIDFSDKTLGAERPYTATHSEKLNPSYK